MGKSLGFFAAGGLASLTMLSGAQAKMVRYEINGHRYAYDINNRQQVEDARWRIAAANAAYAAWVKAEAERSNPLVTLLGSPTQREAADAQARLKQVMSASPPAKAMAGSEAGRAAAAEQGRVGRERGRRRRLRRRRPKKPAAPKSVNVAAKPQPTKETREPAVQSVHFDPDPGIKTTIMTDGDSTLKQHAGAGACL